MKRMIKDCEYLNYAPDNVWGRYKTIVSARKRMKDLEIIVRSCKFKIGYYRRTFYIIGYND